MAGVCLEFKWLIACIMIYVACFIIDGDLDESLHIGNNADLEEYIAADALALKAVQDKLSVSSSIAFLT